MKAPKNIFQQLQIDEFLWSLQRRGFDISLQSHLRVQELLLALADQRLLPENLVDLAPLLAPLLCNNEQQQAQFAGHFDTWLKEQFPSRKYVTYPEDSSLTNETENSEQFGKVLQQAKYWLALLMFLLMTAAWWGISQLDRQPQRITIAGTVVDSLGKAMSNIQMRLLNLQSLTNHKGQFQFQLTSRDTIAELSALDSSFYSNPLRVSLKTSIDTISIIFDKKK